MKLQLRFDGRYFQTAGLVFIFLFALLDASFAAGAPEQLKAFSKLPEIDLRKLERGDIVANRGPIGSFPRGVYAESCYFIHAPPPTVGEKLLHWDSAKHPELEIKMSHEYHCPAAANAWDSLALSSAQREDRWLIERTWQLLMTTGAPTDLHVNRAEKALFREMVRNGGAQPAAEERDATINGFWRQLLRERNDALAAKGIAGLTSYSVGGVRIDAGAELDNLLKLAPAIATHFHALTTGSPFAPRPNSGRVEIAPYWEAAVVRGHTNLHAGFLAARKGAISWQIADCTYYSSDTYFMSVTLYELWPQDDGTLVWQTDFVSAPFRSFSGGLDRIFAGSQMIKETAQTARLFRADVEQGQ